MLSFNRKLLELNISISNSVIAKIRNIIKENIVYVLIVILWATSVVTFLVFYNNGLGLAYNDARSHLNIGRRVVEGLKPGLAQLGSFWLPLPHILMIPTIWSELMWHSGLSGAFISMISFVGTGLLIYKFLEKLKVGLAGRLTGIFVFAANLNILYLQSTAMTELLLIATMTAAVYELMLWHKCKKRNRLSKASFWTMLASLVRYDGWLLLVLGAILVMLQAFKKYGIKAVEGLFFFFITFSAFGIFLWFIWNLLIFGDPLDFAFGPDSARTQQLQLEQAGNLATKGNILLTLQIYLLAMIYNTGAFTTFLGFGGMAALFMSKEIKAGIRISCLLLLTPFIFNIIALFLGHSVLFVQGLSGNTWFNIRYGVMMVPTIAIFTGYLTNKFKPLRSVIIGLLLFVTFFSFANSDAVSIDDAKVGSSQKNVTEVSSWLSKNTAKEKGFILISAASHDAIIFSSGLPMKKYIHEGTGKYWTNAVTAPDRWARWIVMRTNDSSDSTFKQVNESGQLFKYNLMQNYPFADVYQLKDEYSANLNTEPIIGKQK